MENSKIEWCDHSWNPWSGCTRVSPGCQHCYAETMMDRRWGKVQWGPQGRRVHTSPAYWKQPLKWNRKAAAEGVRRRVFCASLADVFEDKADQREEMDEWRADLFKLIMDTPALDWLLLTKRPENVKPLLRRMRVLKRDNVWDHLWADDRWQTNFPNVWIGTSVENQEYADKRIPALLAIPAAVRFLSCEPLLGPIDLSAYLAIEYYAVDKSPPKGGLGYPPTVKALRLRRQIGWVIVGGESGHGARPMHPGWARSIRDQCQVAGVPFFFKQWGEFRPTPEQYYGAIAAVCVACGRLNEANNWCLDCERYMPIPYRMQRIGNKHAGRLLDGREWNEYPVTKGLMPQPIEQTAEAKE